MGDHSKIEWTDATWNPVLGCDRVSAGCAHCYAVGAVARMAAHPNPKIAAANADLTERIPNGLLDWTGVVRCLPERLEQPMRWTRPRRIFVNSLSDLFHPAVGGDFIDAVWDVMARTPRHLYQVLTKRPCRAANYLRARQLVLPNVWVGTSVEDEVSAAARLPVAATFCAAVRWVSYEPAIGRVEWSEYLDGGRFGWVVVGGESGPGARPFHVEWAYAAVAACRAAGAAVFVKQLGAQPTLAAAPWRIRDGKGAVRADFPPDLDYMEWPEGGER